MPKYQCPVEYFAGTVTLPEHMNYAQMIAWEKSSVETRRLFEIGENGQIVRQRPDAVISEFRAIRLPAILECVTEWDLQNVPPKPTIENFPASPKRAGELLYEWLKDLVDALYSGENIPDPNA